MYKLPQSSSVSPILLIFNVFLSCHFFHCSCSPLVPRPTRDVDMEQPQASTLTLGPTTPAPSKPRGSPASGGPAARKAAHSSSLCPVAKKWRRGTTSLLHSCPTSGSRHFLIKFRTVQPKTANCPSGSTWDGKERGGQGERAAGNPQKWSRPGCRMSAKQNACHLYHHTSLWLLLHHSHEDISISLSLDVNLQKILSALFLSR